MLVLVVIPLILGVLAGFVLLDRVTGYQLRQARSTLIERVDVLTRARDSTRATTVKMAQHLSKRALRTTLAVLAVSGVAFETMRLLYSDVTQGDWERLSVFGQAGIIGCALGCLAATLSARSEKARILAFFETVDAARDKLAGSATDSEIQSTTRIALAKELRESALFDRNLTQEFTLTFLELQNMGLFGDVGWRLEPRVNILLGRNGFGKSYLLRLLAGAVANDAATLRRLCDPDASGRRLQLHVLRDGQTATSTHEGDLLVGELGQIPLLAIPDTRFIDRRGNVVSAEGDDLTDLAQAGARRFLEDRPFDSAIQTVLAQMCIEALALGQGGVIRPSTPQLDMVADVVRKLSGEEFRFHRIDQAGSGRFTILVETAASPERPIGINQASQGTLSIVAIFGLIYQFLRATHPSAAPESLCGCKGIVLIDEIDAHLHPAWQRQIVPLLRQRFPAVQFVLTAHSPLVVAGCGRGEVSVLVRENNQLRVVEHQRDFIGASFDEIYREIFEIEERDVTYLALNAKVPRLPELRREVEEMQARPGADQALIYGKLETISTIERLRNDEERELDVERLRREHEQYRLENVELRKRLEQSIAARSPEQATLLSGTRGDTMPATDGTFIQIDDPQALLDGPAAPAHEESRDE